MRKPAKVSESSTGSGKTSWLIPVAVGLLLCLVVAAFSFWVDRRLSRVENQEETQPPSRYEAVDLGAHAAPEISEGDLGSRQAVYVPVYSHVYFAGGLPYPLETTLSIRNTDPTQEVFVGSVRYYDTRGVLAKTYLDSLIRLAPLETIDFLVPRSNSIGGSGANFIVEWGSMEPMNEPLIEAVMVGAGGNQAISFTRAGRALDSPQRIPDSE